MAIHAIGDVQGCFDELSRLLERIHFQAPDDQLWLCGDLVNRGPKSLQVLRLLRSLGDAVRVVLGNHDLLLLALAHGKATPRRGDTAQDVLRAADATDLCEWLQKQPLLQSHGDYLMVHAGLLPDWDVAQAHQAAALVSDQLRRRPTAFLEDYCRASAAILQPPRDDAGNDAAALHAAKVLTTMRLCRPPGDLLPHFSGPPEQAPDGFAPWFTWPHRRPPPCTVLCGHWSALGLHLGPQVVALDSGCVWGGSLSAYNLQSRAIVAEPANHFTGRPSPR